MVNDLMRVQFEGPDLDDNTFSPIVFFNLRKGIHEIKDLFEAIAKNRKASPDFAEGTKAQAVLEAVSRSARSKKWVTVPRV